MTLDLKTIQALVIDMDGVLWRGDTPLPGLTDFFAFIRERELPFMLATNNASKTPDQYVDKLARLGVTVERERIMTSSLATARYLRQEYEPGLAVYVVGQEGLRAAMREVGFTVVEGLSQPAGVVAAGIDMQLTYDDLKYAVLHIQRGARFVGANGDLTFPAEEGYYPGAGSILAAIEAATQVKPTVVGKPQPLMFKVAVEKLGVPPATVAMIGDRLETDVIGAQRAGLQTILVETGVDNRAAIADKGIEPGAVFSGIAELVQVWQEG